MSGYSNGFVVSIVQNGRVLEVAKDGTVAVPFNTEYSIRLRNKHNRRAVAVVYVDDQNVSEGGIVVPAFGFTDLERPTTTATKFKFVSQEGYEAYLAGKSNNEDRSNGVIRVEWRLERERPAYIPTPIRPLRKPTYPHWGSLKSCGYEPQTRGLVGGCVKGGEAEPTFSSYNAGNDSCGFAPQSKGLQEGCTVEGSHSSQTFSTVHVDLESDVTMIMLVLRGFTREHPVPTNGLHCDNCGAVAKKQSAKFCFNCGNKLQ